MKYIVIIGDGMADYPVEELNGKTPLQYAATPCMDSMANEGTVGRVKTIPEGMSPGSDTANLSVLGYDPQRYSTGRSSLEAAGMGIQLEEGEVSFRCNLVTLSHHSNYREKVMLDYCGGEISTEEGKELIEEINRRLGSKTIKFYPGIGYRHLMVWSGGPSRFEITPPHDILNREIGPCLPSGSNSPEQVILEIMKESSRILPTLEINRQRREKGLPEANGLWVWGHGTSPLLPEFFQKYNLRGAVISAVDLIRGIGVSAGLTPVKVEGATGDIHTNFEGKAGAALQTLLEKEMDFVFVHIEAPDECGHRQEIYNKVKAIELIDNKVIKHIVDGLENKGCKYRMLILPDHYTPLSLRTHTAEPVPFLIYPRLENLACLPGQRLEEKSCQEASLFIEDGYKLMDYFIFNGF